MNIQIMSVKDYAEYRTKKGNKISTSAVTKAIRKGYRTPGIISHTLVGGVYILTVNLQELDSRLVAIKKPTKLHS